MDIPQSMAAELAAWNGGSGIDLETWVGCEGNFRLAVGYAAVFWPEFMAFEGYILRKGFSQSSLRAFAAREGSSRKSVEWVMNHWHIDGIQSLGCQDITEDKLVLLGNVIKEIWEAKLHWQFPDKPCVVEFYIPDDRAELSQYQLSFWQASNGAA